MVLIRFSPMILPKLASRLQNKLFLSVRQMHHEYICTQEPKQTLEISVTPYLTYGIHPPHIWTQCATFPQKISAQRSTRVVPAFPASWTFHPILLGSIFPVVRTSRLFRYSGFFRILFSKNIYITVFQNRKSEAR